MINQEEYKSIYIQHSNVQATKFTIVGERHSGTNWIERLVINQLQIPITWEFGSKHFIGYNPNDLAASKNCLFICITRNIYDWIGAFYKLPHHVNICMLHNMETFLLQEWTNDVYDNDYFTKKPYKNLFELRKYKLQYLSIFLPFLVDNLIIIRYEDLISNMDDTINFISNNFNIKKTNKVYGNFIKPRNKRAYVLKKNTIKIINDNTDWDTEKFFKYYPK